jgi:hypothetical protein
MNLKGEYPMSEINFFKGTFIKVQASTTIHLGKLERNLYQGDIVEFDGVTLKIGNEQVVMPELKSGVKRGWLKIVDETPVVVQEVAAPVVQEEAPKVPTAGKPKKEMKVQNIYDEEKSVHNVKKETTEQPAKKFPLKVESQDDDIRPVHKVDSKSGATVTGATSAMDNVSAQQGAESVKIPLKTASKQKLVISDGSQITREMAKLENLSRDAVIKKPVVVVDQQEAEVVSKVGQAPVSVEEDNFEDIELSDSDSDLEVSIEELSEIINNDLQELDSEEIVPELSQFEQDLQAVQALEQTSPTGAIITGTDTSKVVSVDGIDWDKSKHWQHRVKLAIEKYKDNPDMMDKIKAIETDGVVKAIEKALANQ